MSQVCSIVLSQKNYQARHDVIDIQLSICNVCPMVRDTVVYKNKFSMKLSYLGGNQGSDGFIHSPCPKATQISTSTCPDHQLGPSVSVMCCNITVSKSLCKLSSNPLMTIIEAKTKSGFVTEDNMMTLICSPSPVLSCLTQMSAILTVTERDLDYGYSCMKASLMK